MIDPKERAISKAYLTRKQKRNSPKEKGVERGKERKMHGEFLSQKRQNSNPPRIIQWVGIICKLQRAQWVLDNARISLAKLAWSSCLMDCHECIILGVNFPKRSLNQIASLTVSVMVKYLISVIDTGVIGCRVAFYKITYPPRMKRYPLSDLLLSRSTFAVWMKIVKHIAF